MQAPTNTEVADVLERIADLLEAEDSNPFRVRAYREGASTLRNLDQSVSDYVHSNQLEELKALPNIGSGIASVVDEYVTEGKSNLLQDLESRVTPELVFAKIPGIGQKLAHSAVDQLHIRTLPELERAAQDGRLGEVEGFGSRRVEGVRVALAGLLSRTATSKQRQRATVNTTRQKSEPTDRPSVALLLDIDAEYRRKAAAGSLQKIAPRRFNPDNEAWLPVLHAKREGWSFTALFSNTAQAHELEKTDDWVVIYYERDNVERQHTVVTETKGALKGKRVVRGRDPENRQYYSKTVKH
ncbi:MAG: DNA-binding protein [Anaerolineae bacterium]|nr:DNA-binding protein [Anaerolineae bacterium]